MERSIYSFFCIALFVFLNKHCPYCNMCRNGKGLGIDSYHCPTCNCCFHIKDAENHHCIENITHCNCPICEEYLLTSMEKVVVLHCGHSIHEHCLEEYLNVRSLNDGDCKEQLHLSSMSKVNL